MPLNLFGGCCCYIIIIQNLTHFVFRSLLRVAVSRVMLSFRRNLSKNFNACRDVNESLIDKKLWQQCFKLSSTIYIGLKIVACHNGANAK